jgi:hypothetical protein
MSEPVFTDSAHVELLPWLARGSLKQNLLRPIRLWACLQFLYSSNSFKEPFSFSQWREIFFSPSHPKIDIVPHLHDPDCAGAKSVADWIFDGENPVAEPEWRRSLQHHDGIETKTLDELLQKRLFAVTRRSMAEDLEILAELGWLERLGKKYCRIKKFPARPHTALINDSDLALLSNLDLAAIDQSLKEPIRGVLKIFLGS